MSTEKEPCGDCFQKPFSNGQCIRCLECETKLCYRNKRRDYGGYLCNSCWVTVRNDDTTC